MGTGLPPQWAPRPSTCPPPTYAFMLLPLPLSTMYGVFWAFCFSWSKATVPRGVSLELIFFRSCGGMASQHRACRPQHQPKRRPPSRPLSHLLPPRPAFSCAAQSSSCPSPSRGSGGTAAGKPGVTGQENVRAACAPQGGGMVTHLTQCWARSGGKRMGGHPPGLPRVGETGSGDGCAALGALRKWARPGGPQLGHSWATRQGGGRRAANSGSLR